MTDYTTITGKGSFSLLRSEFIEELNATGYIYTHNKTKAQLLYIDAEDDNKVFSISFRTTPMDHTGVAHITEHSVLCGSRKFPLKEPFVELVKGSLNTFLNAMTFPDKTMYPVASKNDKDFRNLMDVYLDAVFFPNVVHDPDIIKQEGWHYEMESVEAPLTYKGVVYNEMKGVYSSPDAILDRHAMELLFPDVTYGIDSGGDPKYIPTLTFEGFRSFYERFYHPSNSYLFLYGTMDLEAQLTFIDEEYLSSFEAIDPQSEIPLQTPFKEPKRAVCTIPVGADEKVEGKSIHTLYLVLPEMTTTESMGMEIMTHALINSTAATLRNKIVKAGLGTDVSASYIDQIQQHMLQVQVIGGDVNGQEEVETLILDTFKELVEKGLPKRTIESSLNRIEFSLREADYGGKPKGLFYNIRVMDQWLYGKDPIGALRYNSELKAVREGLHTRFYEALIEKAILTNPFRLMMTAVPKPGQAEEEELALAKMLAERKASFTAHEKTTIVEETKALAARQAAPDSQEALESIPLLEISDIPIKVEEIPNTIEQIEGATLQIVPEFTNGVSYFNYYFPLDVLTAEELPYAYLLSDVLCRMDTEQFSYQQLTEELDLELGGFSCKVGALSLNEEEQSYLPYFSVSTKALYSNVSRIFFFIEEVLRKSKLRDEARLLELLQELKVNWDMEAFKRGHSLTVSRLLSQVSSIDRFKDAGALGFYEILTAWIKEKNTASLCESLLNVAHKIFRKDGLHILYVGNEIEGIRESVASMLSTWKEEALPRRPFVFTGHYVNEGITSSGQVQYVAQGGNFRNLGFEFTGAMKILETILKYDYLWTRIRVQGGAYGAFASFKKSGDMYFCSYRDPNLENTYQVYEEMADYIAHFNPTEREMRKYIIGTMSHIDIMETPYHRGIRAVIHHFKGNGFYERLQKEILQATATDIRALAPIVRAVIAEGRRVTLGSESKVKQASNLFEKVVALPD